MRSKLLLLSVLISQQTFAIGAAGHATAHANSHASSHVAAHESIAARAIPIVVPHAANTIANTHNAALIPAQIVKGVMTCHVYSSEIGDSDGENYQGCKMGSWNHIFSITIQQFFDIYKPKQATKISMVIYNSERSNFEIYYE